MDDCQIKIILIIAGVIYLILCLTGFVRTVVKIKKEMKEDKEIKHHHIL